MIYGVNQLVEDAPAAHSIWLCLSRQAPSVAPSTHPTDPTVCGDTATPDSARIVRSWSLTTYPLFLFCFVFKQWISIGRVHIGRGAQKLLQ